MRNMPDENEMLTATQLAECLPNKPHANTILRWRRIGQVAANGETIKLRSRRLGSTQYFTLRDLREFGERVAEADRDGEEAKANQTTPAAQRRADDAKREQRIEAAEAELAAM